MAFDSFAELLEHAAGGGSVSSAALAREALESGEDTETLRERMAERLDVMREAAARGVSCGSRSRSGLVGGDAALVNASDSGPVGGTLSRAIALAVAVAESNATMGRVVAAPTGGASGVVPGVLLAVAEDRGFGDEALVDALVTASALGAVVASRTSLSGAAAGCQAEIGVAAAMAAGAVTELLGGTPEQVGHAASLALQGQLGLVCDPVGGLVEVPCVARNATAAGVALAAAEMALAGVGFPIPFDQVAEALAGVGRAMPQALRETAQGGLAVTPAGLALTQGAAAR